MKTQQITELGYDMKCIQRYIDKLEEKDPYTKGHSHHVFIVTQAIVTRLSEKRQKQINKNMLYTAALLHDIGKVMIPDEILNKESPLNDNERNTMNDHPKMGKDMLQNTVFEPLQNWILYHHERIDGKGYYHLEGEHIPFESRIIAVADTFSALRTYRSYRPALSIQETKQIMQQACCTQLDKEVVEALLSMELEQIRTLRCNCGICQQRRSELGLDEDDEAI